MNYLTPNDPGAFLDKTLQSNKENLPHLCPKCKGYGGWNLIVNAYPGNKNPHFSCICDQCHGWGWVSEMDFDHVHEWDRGTNEGRCLTRYRCQIEGCTRSKLVDSSD
jgi:hypothetical protein